MDATFERYGDRSRSVDATGVKGRPKARYLHRTQTRLDVTTLNSMWISLLNMVSEHIAMAGHRHSSTRRNWMRVNEAIVANKFRDVVRKWHLRTVRLASVPPEAAKRSQLVASVE